MEITWKQLSSFVLIGLVGIALFVWYLTLASSDPQAEDVSDQLPVQFSAGENPVAVAQANDEGNPRESVQSSDADPLPTLFGIVSSDDRDRQGVWYDEIYRPSLTVSDDVLISSIFVKVDNEGFQEMLGNSLSERLQKTGQGRSASLETDYTVQLASDLVLRGFTVRASQGSSGFSNYKVEFVSTFQRGNEYLRLEVSPDGAIHGSAFARNNFFEIRSTPDPSVIAVVELDGELVLKDFVVD